MELGVVIIGAGQAGFQAATSLRTEGFDGPITLIGDEPELPYNRPPLSKAFLMGTEPDANLPFRPASFFEEHRIRMLMGVRATDLARATKHVTLDSGEALAYDFLILATGARVRPITREAIPGLLYLRTVTDARLLKTQLGSVDSMIAIGTGFIGLEAAAAAAKLGKRVTIVAAEDRPMSRVVSPLISEHFLKLHQQHGVDVLLNEAVDRVEPGVHVHLKSGKIVLAPLTIAGIGVVPNAELAQTAGLPIANGIIVDQYLRTSDESIFAIGDCADHPNRFAPEGRCRLESIQNAVDQARAVASTIAGKPHAYQSVPWFWTDQYDNKLQIAGIPTSCTQFVARGDAASSAFSIYGFRSDNTLGSVESINRPVDHIQARKLLETNVLLSPSDVTDPDFDWKSLLRPRSH